MIPTKQLVEQKFQEIVYGRYPNIGTYLSSVVSILALIDCNKILDKEKKVQCTSYIRAQITKYEKLWLYYYYELKKENSGLLYKYHLIDDVSENEIFTISD